MLIISNKLVVTMDIITGVIGGTGISKIISTQDWSWLITVLPIIIWILIIVMSHKRKINNVTFESPQSKLDV